MNASDELPDSDALRNAPTTIVPANVGFWLLTPTVGDEDTTDGSSVLVVAYERAAIVAWRINAETLAAEPITAMPFQPMRMAPPAIELPDGSVRTYEHSINETFVFPNVSRWLIETADILQIDDAFNAKKLPVVIRTVELVAVTTP